MSPQDMARVSRCDSNCPACLRKARRARVFRTTLVIISFALTVVSIPVDGLPGVLFAAAGTVFGAVAVVLTRRAMKEGDR